MANWTSSLRSGGGLGGLLPDPRQWAAEVFNQVIVWMLQGIAAALRTVVGGVMGSSLNSTSASAPTYRPASSASADAPTVRGSGSRSSNPRYSSSAFRWPRSVISRPSALVRMLSAKPRAGATASVVACPFVVAAVLDQARAVALPTNGIADLQ
jgi:hypothetical protein